MKKTSMILILGFLVVGLMAAYVYAEKEPAGGDISQGPSEEFNASQHPADTIQAQAGNVTELNISALSQTIHWQGYYGEITGTVTLDDAQNNTMYDWTVTDPSGEVYASNTSTVNWSNVQCLEYQGSGDHVDNITATEAMFGIDADDEDGINETFAEDGDLSDGSTAHTAFYVGEVSITAGSCPATDTYESDSSTGIQFEEVLLTDEDSIIFTTLIENNLDGNTTEITGFDGVTHDFQILVAEDGTDDNTATTPYYFFVEIIA